MTAAATSPTKRLHTNRLINAVSPYLLQHAHNPVDWCEWGPEALDRARREAKPIFLSIGYAACHWCHVMERECFENPKIAEIMNAHYVCIKVDREERPDLDELYMKATQALTGSGGWPMSVWLTPDQRPFYAGTYFPPEPRYGRPGFGELLLRLSAAWTKERDAVVEQADKLTEAIHGMTQPVGGESIPPWTLVPETADIFARAFDPEHGGLPGGGTNKFPPSMAMDLMLRSYHASLGDADGPKTRLLELVELTLERMARGGIFDHLGGGVARYSTDVKWLVPHFEKMLYDQALVSDIYLKAYQLTKKPLHAQTARAILDYVIADLQSPEGGYYSARDADSEDEEGRFYVWSREEVVEALGPDAELFCALYGVTEEGNWEGRNILNVRRSPEEVAQRFDMPLDLFNERIEAARLKLFNVRENRVKPNLDDKILAAWNGLMIASMAKAYRILGDDRYRDSAERAATFVTDAMCDELGRLHRSYRQGRLHTPGFLDDHAFMIDGLLNLYETTFNREWLNQAERLNTLVIERFRDSDDGGFYFTADDADALLVRAKDANDGSIPSGASIQFMNLQRLAVLLGRESLNQEAERMLKSLSGSLAETPHSAERMLCGLDFFHRRPKEIAFACKSGDTDAAEAFVKAAWRVYLPNAVFALLEVDAEDAAVLKKRIPLLAGKGLVAGKPTAYICENFACEAPTNDVDELVSRISP